MKINFGTWVSILCLCVNATIFSQDPPNTQKLAIPFTPAEQALAALELPSGFQATLFAHEPNVIQPIAATTDSRGRLWVVECLTYSDGRENYDLKLHDRVIILEDRDQNGTFDKRTVFWDKGQKLTGIEIGFGGAWLTAAPNLLFIPDVDGDDKPDGPPQILLDGFNGDEIRHNIVNGLRWGPDGWLYGRHGIQATSHVGKPGATASQRTAMNCSIWRYHPVTNQFEIVAEGGTNPWGFDFDDHGEMFMINTVIGHMFHVIPGARYRRMYGAHFNPHTYQVIEQTADHFHWDRSEEHWAVTKKEGMSAGTDAAGGGHAHTGLMCYLGDNWPARYRNQWFTANFHGRRINVERAERDGCGFTARHEPDMIKSQDPWFRGIEMLYGPDGGVFLLDWSDIGECHENDGIHRTSGRIFKITFGEPSRQEDYDLTKWSDQKLIASCARSNQWYFRHARRILQERCAAGADMSLAKQQLELFISEQIQTQVNRNKQIDYRPTLRALWALHAIGATDAATLLHYTTHENEHLRAWAVRLLAELQDGIPQDAKTKLIDMARSDESGLVRLYITSALNHLDFENDFDVYKALLSHGSDQHDRTQPKLLWYRLEPHVVPYWEESISLISSSEIPMIRENIARRLTSEIDSLPEAVAALSQLLQDSARVADVARGMKLALEGRRQVDKPTDWDNSFDRAMALDLTSAARTDLKKINVTFGDGEGLEELRSIAANTRLSVESRRNAIAEYAATRPDGLFEFLKPFVREHAFANAAIEAMVYVDNLQAANIILNRFGHLDPEGKRIAMNTLTTRQTWAGRMLQAVAAKRLPKTAITAQHARQIANFEDAELIEQLSRVWGNVRTTDRARLEEMERVRNLCRVNSKLSTAQSYGRYQVGKRLFAEKCASCHVIYGKGSNVGPDLTGGDRKNMSYLLENILDPNASVADSYLSTKFIMDDGRFLTGVVLQKTKQTTRIQTATEIITIDNSEIDQQKRTSLSLMPDGLLKNLSEDEIRALFHFLSSDRQ